MQDLTKLKKLINYLNITKSVTMVPVLYKEEQGYTHWHDPNRTMFVIINFEGDLCSLPKEDFIIHDLDFLNSVVNAFDEANVSFEYENDKPVYLKIKNGRVGNRVLLGSDLLIKKDFVEPKMTFDYEIDLDVDTIKEIDKLGKIYKRVSGFVSVGCNSGKVALLFGKSKMDTKSANTANLILSEEYIESENKFISFFSLDNLLKVFYLNKDFNTSKMQVNEKIIMITFTHDDFTNKYILLRQQP